MPKYLYCETLTGEWWYKNMATNEDLPLYSTPIDLYAEIDMFGNDIEEEIEEENKC